MRGNPCAICLGGAWLGSIPARAGEPQPAARPTRSTRVYPRPCGGTESPAAIWPIRRGLSPPVRGNPRFKGGVGVLTWSIPARAGEPRARPRSGRSDGVYPRPCGGTRPTCARGRDIQGLSPPVRGNLRQSGHAGNSTGSIPARAGEPTAHQKMCPMSGVYPRPCGGTVQSAAAHLQSRGLSPPVRGNRTRKNTNLAAMGSIPARAGEPSSEPG